MFLLCLVPDFSTPSWGDAISDHFGDKAFGTELIASTNKKKTSFFKMEAFLVQLYNVVDEVLRTT